MNKKFVKRSVVTSLAGLAVLALVACSNAGATDAGNSEAGGGDETATVRVIVAPVFNEPVYIAEQEGYFEDENLNVEIIQGGTAAENAAQLVAGQAEFAMSSGVAVVTGATRGLGIRAVLGATSSDPSVLSNGLVVAGDSAIESYADLEGATVGLQGLNSNTHLATLMAADAAGADASSITFVDLPLPNINEAVRKDDVNVGYATGAFFGQAIDQGLRAIGSPTNDTLAYAPNVLYVASDDYIDGNEDVVKRFQAAMTKASELARADDFAAVRAVQKENTEQDPAVIDSNLISGYQTDLYESGFQALLDGMIQFKFIDKDISLDEVVSPVAPLVP